MPDFNQNKLLFSPDSLPLHSLTTSKHLHLYLKRSSTEQCAVFIDPNMVQVNYQIVFCLLIMNIKLFVFCVVVAVVHSQCSNASLHGCTNCVADNSICVVCDTIGNWNATPTVNGCTCIQGFFKNMTNQCMDCSSIPGNCVECQSPSVCFKCRHGYLVSPTKGCRHCSSVISHCQFCDNDTFCTSCMIGYYESYINQTHQICNNCNVIIGCFACTSESICILCRSGYYISNYDRDDCAQCSVAMLGCITCTSANECSTCNTTNGFQLDDVNKDCRCNSTSIIENSVCRQCRSFMPWCGTCSSTTQCTSCYSLTFTIVEGYNNCVSCTLAMIECIQCTTANFCITCGSTNGFELDTENNNCKCNSTSTVESLICKLCTNLMLNCQSCSSPTFCTICVTGYYAKNENSVYCESCSVVMAGCLQCTAANQCTECATSNGFELDNDNNDCKCNSSSTLEFSTCRLCKDRIAHCLSCSSPIVCNSCDFGYYVQVPSYYCARCSIAMVGCLECDSEARCFVCDSMNNFQHDFANQICKCNFTSILQGTSCVLCSTIMTNCESCLDASSCSDCAATYYENNLAPDFCSLCSIAMTGCLQCINATHCTQCDPNIRFLFPQNNTCSCYQGFWMNISTPITCIECSLTLANCLLCSNPSECTICHYLHIPNSSGLCVLCTSLIPNCDNCLNYTYCSTCAYGYTEIFTLPASQTCSICSTIIKGCLSCENLTICLVCNVEASFFLNGTNCQCRDNSYLSTEVCFACTDWSPQCLTCTNAGCSLCKSKYRIEGTTCVAICPIDACLDCQNNTVCSRCGPHSVRSVDSSSCTCLPNYFFSPSEDRCSACPVKNCMLCFSHQQCLRCRPVYHLDPVTKQCFSFEPYPFLCLFISVVTLVTLSV